MKKLLLLLLLVAPALMAQTNTAAMRNLANTFTASNSFTQPVAIAPTLVGSLPSAASVPVHSVATVTDGTSGSDCTTGGGSSVVLCQSTGAIWVALYGGTPGGSSTQVQFNSGGIFGGSPQFTYASSGGAPTVGVQSTTNADSAIDASLSLGGSDGNSMSWLFDRRGGALPKGMNLWEKVGASFVLRASYGFLTGQIEFNTFQSASFPAASLFDPEVSPFLGAHWVTEISDPAGSNDKVFGLETNYQRNADWSFAQDGSGASPFRVDKNGAIIVAPTAQGPIASTSLRTAGTGYAVNDTGIIEGGNTGGGATYIITSVGAMGIVTGYTVTGAGTTYNVGTSNTVDGGGQPGVGTLFTLNILTISAAAAPAGVTSNAFASPGVTVTQLGSAAAGNKGWSRVVSDSTTVSAEGQTCVGSSSHTALAFSDGTVWKCF